MAELAPGSEFAGYRIEGVAGRGGMGVVYRARQVKLDRIVALKLITPDFAGDLQFRDRFERESRSAAAIEHPNVIPVYEAGEHDGQLFISMRFIDGTDLKALVMGDGALPPDRAVRLVAQVASALDAAHARGLVHRDIKPGNVLIASQDGEDHAYLTDFGLTKHLGGSASGMTKTGMWVGTLDYVAPEQISGRAVDARTDIYSLGCVLFQTLTGEVPYQRDSDVAKLWAHMNEPPPSLAEQRPGLPHELDSVLARAMAKDPDERFKSAGDFARAARAAAQGEMVTDPGRSVATGAAAPQPARVRPSRTSALPPPGPAGWPRWLLPGLAALAGAVLAAGLVLALSGGDDEQRDVAASDSFLNDDSATVTPFAIERPSNITIAEGAVWVLSYERDKMFRIDEESGEGTTYDDVGDGPVVAQEGAGSLWIGQGDSGTIARFDLETGQIVGSPIDLAPVEGDSMAYHEDVLFVAVPDQRRVYRILAGGGPNPEYTTIPGGVGPEIAVSDEALWVVNAEAPTLTRVALSDNRPGKPIEVGETAEDGFRGQIALSDDAAWVASPEDDTVTRVGLDGQVEETIRMPRGLEGDLEFGLGYVWATNDREQLERIDPETNKPLKFPLPGGTGFTGHFEIGSDAIWAAGDPEMETLTRIAP